MSILATLARMKPADLVEAARQVIVLSYIELLLATRRPLPRIAARLGLPLADATRTERGVPMPAPLPKWAMVRLYYAHRLVLRWPFGNTCLRRALLAGHRLRRLEPTLRIGVKRSAGRVAAHAWLEIDGQYFDVEAADFDVLQRVP